MKKEAIYLLLAGLIILIGIFPAQGKFDCWPVLKGPYLGQKSPGIIPEMFAPGIISTAKRELNSVFSLKGDEFYFTIFTPKPVNTCVIMFSRQVNGIWTKPAPAPFSGRYQDVDMAFGPDGNRLYFCSVRGESKHDIWYCTLLKDHTWSDPVKLGPLINSIKSETYPTFTKRGRMYFAALYEGGYGGKDIYYSDQINGKFARPVNVGPTVNTRYDEGDTFVAPDESYLIVSARGRPDSIGKQDLYISLKKKDGTWTKGVNMGPPVNTKVYEYCPMVSLDGKYLFFSRFSRDMSDVFWVDAKILKEYRQ